MPYQFTASPDFGPERLSGLHIFNTWLQRALDEHFHLELFDDFASQRAAIAEDRVDLIYANPYDAAMLVREKGFRAVARPQGKSDEAIIAVNAEHPAQSVEDLQPGISLAATDDPDVRMMGMIMLEPADLDEGNVTVQACDNYVLVAKQLLNGKSDVGFFLAEAFDNLSGLVKNQLRPVVASQIQIIHHSLMAGPKLAHRYDDITHALLAMDDGAKGRGVLEGLGIAGWSAVDEEEVEFMIDLMDTLAG